MKQSFTHSPARNHAYMITVEQKQAMAKVLRRMGCSGMSELTSPGKRIFFLRLLRGITQQELAQAVGIQPSTLSRYERERNQVSMDMLPLFVEHLQTTATFLLGSTKNPERPPVIPEGRSKSQFPVSELEKQILQIVRSFPAPYADFLRETTYYYLTFLSQDPANLREIDYALHAFPPEDTSLEA